MLTRPVLVFDGDCGFCTWSAGILGRWTQGRIDIAPWQWADLLALGLNEADCTQAVQFVDGSGRRSGAAAISGALDYATEPWRTVGHLADRPRVGPLAERAYRVIAANRHLLPGATPACAVRHA